MKAAQARACIVSLNCQPALSACIVEFRCFLPNIARSPKVPACIMPPFEIECLYFLKLVLNL